MNEKTVFAIVGAVAVISLGLFGYNYVTTSEAWEDIDKQITPRTGSRKNDAARIEEWAGDRTDMPPRSWGPNADSVAAQLETVLVTENLLASVTKLKAAYDAEAQKVRDRLRTVANSKLDTWFQNLGTEVRQDDFRARLRTEITTLANNYPVLLATGTQLVDETFATDLSSLERGGLVLEELQFIQKRFWTVEAFLKEVYAAKALKVVSLRALADRDPSREADRKYVTELPLEAIIEITLTDLPLLITGLTQADVFFRIDKLDIDKGQLRDEHMIRAGEPYPRDRAIIENKALRMGAKRLIFDIDAPAVDKAKSDDDLFFELPCLVTLTVVALDSKKGEE